MDKPHCRDCRYYFITFDAQMPYGCRKFGIKTRQIPSDVVKSAGQGECQAFEPKPSTGKDKPKSK